MGSLRAGHPIGTGPVMLLASQFTVLNTDRRRATLRARHDGLTQLAASQVVVYQSVHNHRDVVVTVAASATASVRRLLADPAVMQRFDAADAIASRRFSPEHAASRLILAKNTVPRRHRLSRAP